MSCIFMSSCCTLCCLQLGAYALLKSLWLCSLEMAMHCWGLCCTASMRCAAGGGSKGGCAVSHCQAVRPSIGLLSLLTFSGFKEQLLFLHRSACPPALCAAATRTCLCRCRCKPGNLLGTCDSSVVPLLRRKRKQHMCRAM